MELQAFYEMARDAMRQAEKNIDSAERASRLVVVTPEPVIDSELKAILDK